MSEVARFRFDGEEMTARAGQTIAAALLSSGVRSLRWTSRHGEPRGLFCGMGICHECMVRVNGRPNVRACQIEVADGMCVDCQRGAGPWGPGA